MQDLTCDLELLSTEAQHVTEGGMEFIPVAHSGGYPWAYCDFFIVRYNDGSAEMFWT